ncbi:hypothetical protein JR065_17415 [Xanthomonas sp. AmX2]|uniref:AfsR/SARP family transcriptional regulator n=1 Tax=Xanthomonas sp. TaxID=29446 RepID=UPI00197F334C|nr:BTAD domain-containing putative transcriptional regulator [Xanthomonas sp.]MBN6152126.1 hypothetical protein [Xanthomonas sp.]
MDRPYRTGHDADIAHGALWPLGDAPAVDDAADSPAIRLLGVPALGGRAPAVDLRYRKSWALLAYLALQRRAHRRAALAGLLWPALPEPAALTNLRQVVGDLRRALRAIDRQAWLRCTRATLALDPSARCDVDALETGSAGDAGGALLEGIELDDCSEFQGWLQAARAQCAAYSACWLERHRDALLAAGQLRSAIGLARRLAALDLCNERYARGLMRALASAGAPELAWLEFEQLQRRLRNELDVAPAADTTQLAAALRAGAVPPG